MLYSGILYSEKRHLRMFYERLADIPVPAYSEAIAGNSGIWKSANTGSPHLFSAILYRTTSERFSREIISDSFSEIEIAAPECDGEDLLSPSLFIYEESAFNVYHETGLSPLQRENYKVFEHIPKNKKHYVYYIVYVHCTDTILGFR